MGHALFWIETLAAGLAFMALVTAWTGRWSRRWTRGIVLVLALLLLLGTAGLATGWTAALRFQERMPSVPFFYSLSWTIALTLGAGAVLFLGLRRGREPAPAARAWSVAKLTLVLGALLIVSWITLVSLDLAVDVQLASLRVEAGARMLALMPPRLSDRQNAARVYQEAFAALTPMNTPPPFWREVWDRTSLDNSATVFDPRDERLRLFLETQERGMALLRQAAAMPDCWFEHDYFASFDRLVLPELQSFRHGALLLAHDAVSKAAHGKSTAALEDLAAIFGIVRHINESEPFVISVAVSHALEKLGARALEEVLALNPPQLQGLGRLAPSDNTPDQRLLQRAYQVEESLGLLFFAMLADPESVHELFSPNWQAQGAPHLPRFVLFDLPIYRVFFLGDDLAAYRQVMKEIQQLTTQPYYEAYPGWQEYKLSWARNHRGIMTRFIAPATQKFAIMAHEGDALRHLVRLALAMTAYRAKHDKYPDQLKDLVPEFLLAIPLDPFDGKPLRMKRDDKGVVLYSVGPTLKDDGGALPRDRQTRMREGEIVFRLP